MGLQGAALRVVVKKPARASFQGTRGDGRPLAFRSGGPLVPPVSDGDPPAFHCWEKERMRPPLGANTGSTDEEKHL